MEEELKSRDFTDAAFITFRNLTTRVALVIWYDYSGNRVIYGKLVGQHQSLDVNTYKTHPWVVIDAATGANLLVNGNPVFYPISVREIHERLRLVQVPLRSLSCGRSPANITCPLFSLLDLCQHMVMRSVRSDQDVDSLDIPVKIKESLKEILLAKESLKNCRCENNVTL